MKKEKLIKQLEDNNLEWNDTGIVENYPYRRVRVRLKKEPEWLLMLTINEDNDDIVFSLFENRETVASGITNNQNVINVILEYINNIQ